jgi:hypothetical protein
LSRRPDPEQPLSQTHQDVLRKRADEWCVVPDARDAKTGRCHGALEIGDVRERVHVIGLSQPLLTEVDEADAFETACQRVDATQAKRQRRVLPHVRVHEELTSRTQHPRDLGQHMGQCVARQMLEHVEGVRLVHRSIGERQAAQIAKDQRAVSSGFAGKERRHVDSGHGRAAAAVPDQRAAAAAPQVEHEVRWSEPQEPAQHPLPNTGLQQRRRDGLVTRVRVQRIVEVLRLLLELGQRPQVEAAARGRKGASACAAAGLIRHDEGAAAVGTAQCRLDAGAPAIRPCAGAPCVRRGGRARHGGFEQRLQTLGALLPRVLGGVRARLAGEPYRERTVVDQSSDRRRERVGVARRGEKAVLPWPNHLADGRQIRRHDGPPRGEILEQLQRRGVSLRDDRRGVGEHEQVARRQRGGYVPRRQQPRERDPIADAGPRGMLLHPGEVAFGRVAADDETTHARHASQRVDEHFHALPRIKVAGVADDRRIAEGRFDERSMGRQPDAIMHDSQVRARSEARLEVGPESGRDRDVAIGPIPDTPLARFETRELPCRRRGCSRNPLGQVPAHLRSIAVRLVHERRPQRARHARQQRRHAEIACEGEVGPGERECLAERPGEIARTPGAGRNDGCRDDAQPRHAVEVVERKRIAWRIVHVGTHEQRDLVARRERRAGGERLDAIGPLEREPDVGEIQNVQGLGPARQSGWRRRVSS